MKRALLFALLPFSLFQDVAVGLSPGPFAKPKIALTEAVQKGTEYAKGKIDLANYYMDRVWLTVRTDTHETVWAVSFAPDPKADRTEGWYYVIVDQNGQAMERVAAIPWAPEMRNVRDHPPEDK
jgi:hypothetical protein